MLDLNEIGVKEKKLFGEYLKLSRPQISEMTFTNFFMWRNAYNFRYSLIEGFLCIIAEPENKAPFAYMPLGNIDNIEGFEKAVSALCQYFSKNGMELNFKRIPEESLDLFTNLTNTELKIDFDRNNSDYVYLTSDLINLKGKKYDGKRNHINKFNKLHEYKYLKIDKSNIRYCYDIMNQWCVERDCKGHCSFYCEKLATFELLDNYDVLSLKGALIEVDGKPEAFTVGELLNEDTAVIHLEKADGKIHGLYTIINQQFCLNEWQNTKYINREQDLGIEGMRKAKLSYNPVSLMKKYSVSFSDR